MIRFFPLRGLSTPRGLSSLRNVAVTMWLLVRHDKRRAAVGITLIFAQSLSGPVLAVCFAALTTAAVERRAAAALVFGAATGVLVVIQLTMGHFANNTLAKNGYQASAAICAELIMMVQDSGDLAVREDSEYADRLGLLCDEVPGLVFAVQALLVTVAVLAQLAVSMWLLGRMEPALLLLLPLAVVPFLLDMYAHRVEEAAFMATGPARRGARHLLDLALQRGTAQEVRLAGLQDELRRRQRKLLNAEADQILRAQLLGTLAATAGQVVFALGYAGAVILTVSLVVTRHGSVGNVVLVITLAGQINAGVTQILQLASTTQRAVRIGARWGWLRTADARARRRTDGASAPERITDGITLDSVCFRYPGADTDSLHNLNLTLPAGSVVAVVGENGAGKSTLVKLLCRLYQPTAGTITVDGQDLAAIAAASWQDATTAAFQDYGKLEFTLAQTVGVGDLPRIDNRTAVGAAVEQAGAGALLTAMPAGLDTELGTSFPAGRDLSGGQWQKLALARSMMRRSPLLLIMDEPTAALDATAEHALFERQTQLARGVADRNSAITILVSHRFSTVAMADRIVVIDGGTITEQGTHAELMAANGSYAELYKLQAGSYHRTLHAQHRSGS